MARDEPHSTSAERRNVRQAESCSAAAAVVRVKSQDQNQDQDQNQGSGSGRVRLRLQHTSRAEDGHRQAAVLVVLIRVLGRRLLALCHLAARRCRLHLEDALQ